MSCCVVFLLCCGGGGKNPKFAEKMLWPRVFGGPQLQVPDFFQESRGACSCASRSKFQNCFGKQGARAARHGRVQNILGSKVKGAGASAHITTPNFFKMHI